jgi:hypothetical protein
VSKNAKPPVGSIWTVRGVEAGHGLVILGPILRESTGAEFVVVPVYTGSEPGFGWTDQDVRMEPEETSYAAPTFLGVWNARPVLERNLERFVMRVPDAHIAIAIAQDVYWAGAQSRRLKHPRLGSALKPGSKTEAFQRAEMAKWAAAETNRLGTRNDASAEHGARTPSSGRVTT